MDNEGLKAKYDQMHKQGASAWFDDGQLERELILKMGEPWEGLGVLEIGCGEGDLAAMMAQKGADTVGLDYSLEAINKASKKYPSQLFVYTDHRQFGFGSGDGFYRIVLQGVLEHLDDPFAELDWMIDHFKPQSVITSSPGFLNPRGIVWMTLHMLGGVMSKTDLHHLNPWQFEEFCKERGYRLTMESTDNGWGYGEKMVRDLKKRIPLALQDGRIPYEPIKVLALLDWLKQAGYNMPASKINGAVICYRIDL